MGTDIRDGDGLEEDVVMIVPFCEYTKIITVLLKWLKCMVYELYPNLLNAVTKIVKKYVRDSTCSIHWPFNY